MCGVNKTEIGAKLGAKFDYRSNLRLAIQTNGW
jgi:hypothetical protein